MSTPIDRIAYNQIEAAEAMGVSDRTLRRWTEKEDTMKTEELPIREAAKAVHKSRQYVRKLIESGEVVAIVAGGTDEAPWLRVNVAELREAIRRTSAYVPKDQKRRGVKVRPPHCVASGRLHPSALAM